MLIERRYSVTFSKVHVWLLLSALSFSSLKPEHRAIERDGAALQAHDLRPRLKKSVPLSDG